MLFQVDTNIMVIVLDLMHIHSFHRQTEAGSKISLFLALMGFHLCMLILKRSTGPTQGVDNTAITAEDKYPKTFIESGKKILLSLHYKKNNSFFVC